MWFVNRVFDVVAPALAAILLTAGPPVFVTGAIEPVAARLGFATNERPGFDNDGCTQLAWDAWSWAAFPWRLVHYSGKVVLDRREDFEGDPNLFLHDMNSFVGSDSGRHS